MSRPKAPRSSRQPATPSACPEEELVATRAVFSADIVLLDYLDTMIDEADQQPPRRPRRHAGGDLHLPAGHLGHPGVELRRGDR